MTGESVIAQPNVTTPRFSTLFAKIGAIVRQLVAGLHVTRQERALPRPFPFFGE